MGSVLDLLDEEEGAPTMGILHQEPPGDVDESGAHHQVGAIEPQAVHDAAEPACPIGQARLGKDQGLDDQPEGGEPPEDGLALGSSGLAQEKRRPSSSGPAIGDLVVSGLDDRFDDLGTEWSFPRHTPPTVDGRDDRPSGGVAVEGKVSARG